VHLGVALFFCSVLWWSMNDILYAYDFFFNIILISRYPSIQEKKNPQKNIKKHQKKSNKNQKNRPNKLQEKKHYKVQFKKS